MGIEDNLRELELHIKSQELEVKKAEERNKAWELYNAFARDTRTRADGLVRAILLISGGALTLSIGAFLRPEHPALFPACLNLLHLSWTLLVTSMILAVAVVFVGVLASDLHGQRWLSWLRGGRKNELRQPRKVNYILWALGVLAILSHWAGLGLLAYLATRVVTT